MTEADGTLLTKLHDGSDRSATSCVLDRVPPEILSHILGITFLSFKSGDSRPKYRFPSIISQVSRLFHQIAHATPLLWSYLRIPSDRTDRTHIQARIEKKSGVLPLDIFIALELSESGESTLAILEECPNRWGNLHIKINRPRILGGDEDDHIHDYGPLRRVWEELESLLRAPTLSLQSLFVENEGLCSWFPPSLSLPNTVSPIRTLRLEGCGFSWSGALPPTLESLSILQSHYSEVDPSQIVACLGGSISNALRSLSIDGFYVDLDHLQISNDFVEFPPCVVLENLEFLEIRGSSLQMTVVGLNILQTPKLRQLSLQITKDSAGDRPTFPSLLRSWKAHRIPGLEELTLRDMEVPGDGLVHFLQHLPDSVVRLNIIEEEWARMRNILDAIKDRRVRHFRRRLQFLNTFGLALKEVMTLMERRFRSLKMLKVRIKDHGFREDKVSDEASASLALLQRFVPSLEVTWIRPAYYHSVRDEDEMMFWSYNQVDTRIFRSPPVRDEL